MKVKDLIKKFEDFDQEADIFFLEEDKETGDENCFNFAICENQVSRAGKIIERYYTIEKRD